MNSTMPFSEIKALGPPKQDEIELSVFGPSFGECSVIHLGDNRWAIIDSCTYTGIADPVPLHYLSLLGVSPSAVESILITHWHDDHCKGISKLIDACPNAKIWIAQTLTDREFIRFVKRISKNKTTVAGLKTTEFNAVLNEIVRRKTSGSPNYGFASQGMTLLNMHGRSFSHNGAVRHVALSPSPGDQYEFLVRIAEAMPQARQQKGSLGSPSPNEVSVATLLEIGPSSIILGADLENNKPSSGWDAILAANRVNPFGMPAAVYKVAHHGSLTAHHPGIWKELLVANDPIAILTPWSRGRGRLPNKDGIKEITDATRRAFATTAEAGSRPKRRHPSVQTFLRTNNIQVHSINAPAGFVRLRKSPGEDWKTELFGAACSLNELRRRRRLTKIKRTP